MGKKEVAAQIKRLIDVGDFQGAQTLISQQVNTPIKKRGRPPKVRVEERSVVIARAEEKPLGCIAPSRRPDAAPTKVIGKDGKEHLVSKRVPWSNTNNSNKFKDDRKLAKNEMGLNYPEPSQRRDPTLPSQYICSECNNKDMLYPGQGPAEEMLYICERCMKRGRRR